MQEDGEDIPAPSGLDDIMADPENGHSIAVVAIASEVMPRALRVNVTIPKDVLDEIDRYAEEKGLTRSGLLTHAAKRFIKAA